MNWETTQGGSDYHSETYPWSDMVKEKKYEYFTTFRKYYTGGGWYRVTVLNWELDKISGKLKPAETIREGIRFTDEAKRSLREKRG